MSSLEHNLAGRLHSHLRLMTIEPLLVPHLSNPLRLPALAASTR